ncbi:hypothetical protein U4E84_04020 [Halorubrum sp. AD140]|uniref:hypothetical protein n=1 Tax=Halorubrum sp. AD140 TaxID=3050073 RepID=UPI002ACD1B71|nr:hypothetical protein [Halorubrum sp. AD140]MDZ5810517.1 hypothetical protein [Halorubrum sp. AD140]
MRVIDRSKSPLYRLFAESSARIGVALTAVYEGHCFNLNKFVFETHGADMLQPLVEDGIALFVEDVDELTT